MYLFTCLRDLRWFCYLPPVPPSRLTKMAQINLQTQRHRWEARLKICVCAVKLRQNSPHRGFVALSQTLISCNFILKDVFHLLPIRIMGSIGSPSSCAHNTRSQVHTLPFFKLSSVATRQKFNKHPLFPSVIKITGYKAVSPEPSHCPFKQPFSFCSSLKGNIPFNVPCGVQKPVEEPGAISCFPNPDWNSHSHIYRGLSVQASMF